MLRSFAAVKIHPSLGNLKILKTEKKKDKEKKKKEIKNHTGVNSFPIFLKKW